MSGADSKSAQVKTNLVPTNSVKITDDLTIRARIEPTLTVDDVIKQLCINLQIKEPENYALRDETDELVTNENLRRKIKMKVNLKLVNSPAREAQEIVKKLADEKPDRMTLFSLQKFIREPQFARTFLEQNGLALLVEKINITSGNTLAYALAAMQNLMDLDYGWDTLHDTFILRVVKILSSSQVSINVCRPATAILKKLVEAEPLSTPASHVANSSRSSSATPLGSIYRYGFTVVFEQMRKEKDFLETVVSRLDSADTATAQYSMMLINSLLAHVSDERWNEFISELEKHNVRKAVVRLMSLHTVDDLMACILDFQANIVRVTYHKKTTPVDPVSDPAHGEILQRIWDNSKLMEDEDLRGGVMKWRQLGFETEEIALGFDGVGTLGLYCLDYLLQSDPEFSKIVLEQLSRPATRRCPVAKASNETVELLSEHWAIFAHGYSTSTTLQPYFLDFYRIHSLATKFFIRVWNESGAAFDDFRRVADLVRSQIKVGLKHENLRSWHEIEHDFLESEYRAVRDRQMKELELEDDFLSKIPVRNLRNKLYKESFDFVRQQRIQCLLQGAWFINGIPVSSHRDHASRTSRPWRFVRLDNSQKYLHYVDSAVKFPVRSGLEDLPERIDVSLISQVATKTCYPPIKLLRDHTDPVPSEPSPFSFSLLSTREESLADMIASDEHRWADWTDGLNMLRRDGGHATTKETAEFVQALTDIGLKIKLLDLSGDKVEIPSGLIAGPPPANTDYFFADIM